MRLHTFFAEMPHAHHRYFAVHKPFGMVSQFVSLHAVPLLGDLDFDFPEGSHAIGRLDAASEGLLLITTDKRVTQLLFQGEMPHRRSYLVRVKGVVEAQTISRLEAGIPIRISENEFYTTAPCGATLILQPEKIFPGALFPERKGPHSWLLLSLTEGKYHQVRKMVGVMRHRCQRLVRVAIEDLHLGDLPAGGVKEMSGGEFFRLLKIAT